ncbi:remorin-like [Arachis stenosperma]|uniref:remorin-like n=1 Tax=Arachis stenosperma TaxID=217475 RepID=UPI0025ABCBF4|nr:remorin-like [Arachis stenosperma]
MAEQQVKVEAESAPVSAPASPPVVAEVPLNNDTASDDSKALVVVPQPQTPPKKLESRGSLDRDVALAEVTKEKKLAYVKAWEESEKTKIGNKAEKHHAAVVAWEDKKKAALFLELKKFEEKLEKKKAAYAEKMKNKAAMVHQEAEEKRAVIEAKRGENVLKIEDMAAKHRATGTTPKKPTMGCF